MKTTNYKLIAIFSLLLALGSTVNAQIVTKKAVDNKGTINTLLDATTTVITSAGNGITVDNTVPTNPKVELGGTLTKPTTITTAGLNTLKIDGLATGAATDDVLTLDAAGVLTRTTKALNDATTASNGLTKTGVNIALGGALTAATIITTTGSETLALTGLAAGDLATDNIVVSSTGGVLKSVAASTLLTSGATNFATPTLAQATYAVPNMPADASRVWVYRNGVKLIGTTDYTTAAASLTLVPAIAALVVVTDNIEVQWVK